MSTLESESWTVFGLNAVSSVGANFCLSGLRFLHLPGTGESITVSGMLLTYEGKSKVVSDGIGDAHPDGGPEITFGLFL